jgi:DNA polymerase I-like protein with 3'-5' exonuclease and polymerase domains
MLAHHYVENAYGRRRYFSKTDDTGLLAAYKRQAQNSPIQGTVGDMLNLALINIRQYRDAAGLQFKLVLPVHDAIFIEAPVHEARHIYQDVMPACMSDLIPVPGTKLVIRADVSIVKRWGEKMKLDEAIEFAEEELRQLNATKGKS